MTQQGQGFPEADDQFEDNTITRVERSGSSFDITTAAGWSLWCGDNCPLEPQAGMTVRIYGHGIGSRVRGLFINGQKFWYRTEAEDKEHASIEMGGIGPGYEQAIQITAAEQLRWLLKTAPAHSDLMDRAKWPAIRDAMDTVLLDDDGPVKRLGLSGAQWGMGRGHRLVDKALHRWPAQHHGRRRREGSPHPSQQKFPRMKAMSDTATAQQGQGDVVALEDRVRKMTHSLPPSDLGSTRAIQAITAFVEDELTRLRTLLSSSRGEQGWQLVPKEAPAEMFYGFMSTNATPHDTIPEIHSWRGDFGNFRASYNRMLAAAPSAPGSVPTSLAGQVPDGYVLVPAKATDGMAAYAKHRNPGVSESLAKGIWHCMVDQWRTEEKRAAPQPTAGGDA